MFRLINDITKTLFIILLLFNIGCSQETAKEDISCKQAWDLIQKYKADSNFVIIDFRPKEKYDYAHIDGAIYYDVFLPDVDGWIQSQDTSKTYLIYCTIGHRSRIGLNKMKELNFQNLYHIHEGLRKWQAEGFEVVSEKKTE